MVYGHRKPAFIWFFIEISSTCSCKAMKPDQWSGFMPDLSIWNDLNHSKWKSESKQFILRATKIYWCRTIISHSAPSLMTDDEMGGQEKDPFQGQKRDPFRKSLGVSQEVHKHPWRASIVRSAQKEKETSVTCMGWCFKLVNDEKMCAIENSRDLRIPKGNIKCRRKLLWVWHGIWEALGISSDLEFRNKSLLLSMKKVARMRSSWVTSEGMNININRGLKIYQN